MNLQHLALFFIGAGIPYLGAYIILLLTKGKHFDDNESITNSERVYREQTNHRGIIGGVAVSIGVLLYIAYRIFQAG